MANYNPGNSTAQDYSDVTKEYLFTTPSSYTVQHFIRILKNFNVTVTDTLPGWLTGRRPTIGQQFPRGVYNK